MSTVAYRDGTMAADTIMSFNSELMYGVHKVGRTKRFLFGFVGQFAGMAPLYDWLVVVEQMEDHPEKFYKHAEHLNMGKSEGSALIADEDGKVWQLLDDGGVVRLNGAYQAVGSGDGYAHGALFCGADAHSAVEAAINFDAFTGGHVETVDFSSPIHAPHQKGA